MVLSGLIIASLLFNSEVIPNPSLAQLDREYNQKEAVKNEWRSYCLSAFPRAKYIILQKNFHSLGRTHIDSEGKVYFWPWMPSAIRGTGSGCDMEYKGKLNKETIVDGCRVLIKREGIDLWQYISCGGSSVSKYYFGTDRSYLDPYQVDGKEYWRYKQ